MRKYPRFISAAFLAAVFSLVPIPAIVGQDRSSGSKGVMVKDLSDGAEYHYSAPFIEPATEKSSAGKTPDGADQKPAQQNYVRPTSALDASPANMSGTVTDVNGDLIPGADIVLEGAS